MTDIIAIGILLVFISGILMNMNRKKKKGLQVSSCCGGCGKCERNCKQ